MPLVTHVSEQSVRGARLRGLAAIGLFLWGACFTRLAYLQLIRGRALARISDTNRTQILVERAPRGRILDRHGDILADDRPVFVALFSPVGLKATDVQATLARLSPIIRVHVPELERRLKTLLRSKSMMRIADRLDRTQAFLILQDRMHLPGISLSVEEQRYYPKGTLASHVLGHVGSITEEELEDFADQDYQPGDWIGKTGIERFYDTWLHGQDGGYLLEVDALGRQVRLIRHLTPKPGKDITLTIDGSLQALAENALRRTGRPGAAVVLNPQTGEVLTLASSPGFDPNVFLPLGSSDDRKKLLTDTGLPLFNRAIQGTYPPGSIFKIITALATLEGHRLDPEERVECTGAYAIGKERRIFHCWKRTGHGRLDLQGALVQSCDIYYYRAGLSLGPETLERYARTFGMGQLSGLDLPSEKRGNLPWAYKTARGQHWQSGETLNYAIGQGALQVTPLQMANLVSTVSNGGRLWRPSLLKESAPPHLISQVPVDPKAWHRLQNALQEVVKSGTGMAAQIQGVAVGGKTGTAEVSKGKEHGWYVGYAPADRPRVACAVVIENGGHGGVVAAPIARDLMAQALGVEAVPLVPWETLGD